LRFAALFDGFRAPNLGELYGLTQFAATLTDRAVRRRWRYRPKYVAGCTAQGVPAGVYASQHPDQTFTGGNLNLRPEKSDSYTAGIVYHAGFAEGHGATERLQFEGHLLQPQGQGRDPVRGHTGAAERMSGGWWYGSQPVRSVLAHIER